MRAGMPTLVAAAVMAVVIPTTANAQLLQSVVGTVGDVVDTLGETVETVTGGGGSTGGLVTTNNGPADSGGVVNLGIGDGGSGTGNLVDLSLGGSGSGVRGNVGVGGNALFAGLDLSGLGLDVSLGLNGSGSGGPGAGGPGGAGGQGGLGVGGGRQLASLGRNGQVNCSIEQGRRILQHAADNGFSPGQAGRWRLATNIRIVPVRVCPSTRRQIAQVLRQSGKMHRVWGAVAHDALIMASLKRSRNDVFNVFAVTHVGAELTVYVY